MKRYILIRTLRSLFSVFCVVTLAMILIYTQIDRERVFKEDATLNKIKSQPDAALNYKYTAWEQLGYLDYLTQSDMCAAEYSTDSTEFRACMEKDSAQIEAIVEQYRSKGYTIDKTPREGNYYASRDYTIIERIINFYSGMIEIDNPYRIQDPNNPDLERKIYFGTDLSGTPAIKCSGCEHKYLIYFDSSFPFIHQNIININLGVSYVPYKNQPIVDVITNRQGATVKEEITFETGQTSSSAILEHTCTYKSTLDALDPNKFLDHYANCTNNMAEDSMMAISFKMGILSILFAYLIALPVGILMARKKGKIADKLGMSYIVFIIAVPSLAYISLFRFLGNSLFGLPGKWPEMGGGAWQSWVLPIFSLTLPSISGLMMWTRRYMVDQSTADYVKFAKAKGLSEGEIFTKHILKNAIIPIAHGIPGNIVGTISGAVITESIYAVSGMGKLLPDSIKAFNNQMVIALTFMFTFLSIFSLFAGDLLVTAIDPRISLVNNAKGGRK